MGVEISLESGLVFFSYLLLFICFAGVLGVLIWHDSCVTGMLKGRGARFFSQKIDYIYLNICFMIVIYGSI